MRPRFNDNKDKTYIGLQKSDLVKSMSGNIVTRQQHAAGKKACACIKGWVGAVRMARNELGMKGFCCSGDRLCALQCSQCTLQCMSCYSAPTNVCGITAV